MKKVREQAAADHMIDVLVTQHSRWTARRIHRALFGQSLIDFGGDSWSCVSSQAGKAKISNRCRGKKCAMQSCILSKFSRQFTSSREAGGTTEVFLEEEESPVEYVSSDNDSSEEDDEEHAEQEADFPGIGTDERTASPVREAPAIHTEDPAHREEAHFAVLHPNVDQTESTHRTDILDATD